MPPTAPFAGARTAALIAGILGLVFLIGGGVLLAAGLSEKETLALLEAAIPATVADCAAAPPGPLVRVRAAIGAQAPGRMPGEGEAAIFGRLTIRSPYHRSTGSSSSSRSHSTSYRDIFSRTVHAGGPFLEDGGARLAIDDGTFREAEIDIPLHKSVLAVESSWGDTLGSSLFGASSGRLVYGDIDIQLPSDRSGSPKLEKRLLAPGDRVLVIGRLGRAGETPTLLAPEGTRLRVYLKTEDELLRDLASGAAWHIPVGATLLGLGGFLLVGAGIAFVVILAKGR